MSGEGVALVLWVLGWVLLAASGIVAMRWPTPDSAMSWFKRPQELSRHVDEWVQPEARAWVKRLQGIGACLCVSATLLLVISAYRESWGNR